MLSGWYIHRHVKSDLLVKFHKCFNAAGLRVNLLQVEIMFQLQFLSVKSSIHSFEKILLLAYLNTTYLKMGRVWRKRNLVSCTVIFSWIVNIFACAAKFAPFTN